MAPEDALAAAQAAAAKVECRLLLPTEEPIPIADLRRAALWLTLFAPRRAMIRGRISSPMMVHRACTPRYAQALCAGVTLGIHGVEVDLTVAAVGGDLL